MNLLNQLPRFIFLSLTIIHNNCSSAPKSIINIDNSQNDNIANIDTSKLPMTIGGMSILNASDFGCKGDAVQLNDFSIIGNQLSSNSAGFKNTDIGKVVSIARAGIDGEHLVSSIISILSSKSVLLQNSAANAMNNVTGSFGTDNINYIQQAVDAAISKQKMLFFEKGVFLVGDNNSIANSNTIEIRITRQYDNIVLIGSGKYETIFRELDGKTQRQGRYTKLFYHYLKDSPNVGTIVLADFSLDKNGRSLTKGPNTIYGWEQAHAWSWAGHKNGPEQIKNIFISDIEIIDKIGGGINFSSTHTNVGSVLAQNITVSKPYINPYGAVYGPRGDLELSCFSENIVIKNVDLNYIQLEPVKSQQSSKSNKRKCVILDSNIGTIEYTETKVTERGVSILEIKNSSTDNFSNLGVEFLVENSTIRAPKLINSYFGKFENCKFLLSYNELNNSIKTINASYLRTVPNDNQIEFNNCEFLIDSNLETLRPDGFALTSNSKMKVISANQIVVENCTFDPRLQGSIDAYANGKWTIVNSKLAGQSVAIRAGGYKDYFSEIILENNDYSRVIKSAAFINIQNHNTLWKLEGFESINNFSSSITSKGKIGNLKRQNLIKSN